MLDKQLMENKLSDLSGYYQRLEELTREDTLDIIKDDLKLHTVERLFQLIVDIAIDINTHIISEKIFTCRMITSVHLSFWEKMASCQWTLPSKLHPR